MNNLMMRRTNWLKLKLVRFHMDGMISWNISVTIKTSKKFLKRNKTIWSPNLSKKQKTLIGGEPSETNSIKEISDSPINNFNSLIESDKVKWHLKLLLLLNIHSNSKMMILFHWVPILQPKEISCHQNGNKWKSTKFLMDYFQEE